MDMITINHILMRLEIMIMIIVRLVRLVSISHLLLRQKCRSVFLLLKPFITRNNVETSRYINVPYFAVQYLFDNKHITLDHVYAYIKPTYTLSKNTFKETDEFIRATFDL